MTHIITHRGLDPAKPNYFFESSMEAFQDQLERGYGLEFDPQMTSDGEIIVLHDSTLKRLTKGEDTRAVSEVTASEILLIKPEGCHLTTFHELLIDIEKTSREGSLSAIHLKHGFQSKQENIDAFLRDIEVLDPQKFIIFDTTLYTAQYLKTKNPNLHIAPSVSHPYDIKRYQNAVGGTLFTIDEVLHNRTLFDWVWLDEWDLSNTYGGIKRLYTREIFSILREDGLKIGLVTPELHGTSPGLLGGEAHPDAKNHETLFARFQDILALKPDAVCSDYPDVIASFLS